MLFLNIQHHLQFYFLLKILVFHFLQIFYVIQKDVFLQQYLIFLLKIIFFQFLKPFHIAQDFYIFLYYHVEVLFFLHKFYNVQIIFFYRRNSCLQYLQIQILAFGPDFIFSSFTFNVVSTTNYLYPLERLRISYSHKIFVGLVGFEPTILCRLSGLSRKCMPVPSQTQI